MSKRGRNRYRKAGINPTTGRAWEKPQRTYDPPKVISDEKRRLLQDQFAREAEQRTGAVAKSVNPIRYRNADGRKGFLPGKGPLS